MSPTKQQVMDVLADLPDDCTLDEVVLELQLLSKFDEAEAAVEAGLVYSHEDAIQRVREWPKSSGPTLP